MSASKITSVLLASVLAGLALSACGDDNKGATLPSNTATASASTAPAEPVALREHSAAGVEAAARYYIDLLNYAKITGDTSALERLSLPGCKSCANHVDSVRERHDKGWRIVGGQNRVAKALVPALAPNLIPTADLHVDFASEQTLSRDGEVMDDFAGAKARFVFTLIWDGNAWHVGEIQVGGS